jgi:hypothetical protein
MAGIKTLLAAAVLTVGMAATVVAQPAKSPDEGFETSKGGARQTNVDEGKTPAMGKKTTTLKKMKSNKMTKKKMKKGTAPNGSSNAM